MSTMSELGLSCKGLLDSISGQAVKADAPDIWQRVSNYNSELHEMVHGCSKLCQKVVQELLCWGCA